MATTKTGAHEFTSGGQDWDGTTYLRCSRCMARSDGPEASAPCAKAGGAREDEIRRVIENISHYAAPMIAGALVAVLREDNAPPKLVANAEALMKDVLRWWGQREVG